VSVRDLKTLHNVFKVDDAALAEFRVDAARLHQVAQLALAHRTHRCYIEGCSPVEEGIAQRLQFLTECGVPRDGAQFHQCLPLVWPRWAGRREIAAKCVQ